MGGRRAARMSSSGSQSRPMAAMPDDADVGRVAADMEAPRTARWARAERAERADTGDGDALCDVTKGTGEPEASDRESSPRSLSSAPRMAAMENSPATQGDHS